MATYGTSMVSRSESTDAGNDRTAQRLRIQRTPGDLATVATGMLIQGGVAAAAAVTWLAMLIMATREMISFETLSNSLPLYVIAALAFVAGEAMGVTAPKASRAQTLCIAGLICTVLAAVCAGSSQLSPAAGLTLRMTLDILCFAFFLVRVIVTSMFLVRISRYADLRKFETQATFVLVGQPFAVAAATLYLLYAPQVTEEMTSGLRLATRGFQIWIVVTVVSVAVMTVSTLIGMGQILRRE